MIIKSGINNILGVILLCVLLIGSPIAARLDGVGWKSIIVFCSILLIIILKVATVSLRKIVIDEKGCTVCLLFLKKKYSWDELKIKRFEQNKIFVEYSNSVVFSKNITIKPKWLDPGLYMLLSLHVFSFFYIYLKHTEDKNKPVVTQNYEVDESLFNSKMAEWGITIEK